MLDRLGNEMESIHKSIEGLVAMEESLKGEGGNTIRAFYLDSHLPFLQFFKLFQSSFTYVVIQMDAALDALEPDSSGFIREHFLDVEIEQGLKAVMKKFVNNYDPNTAPAINDLKVGHTIKGPNGIVSRNTKRIENPRQLLARDIMELRRVYDDIPNSTLKELVELNKKMYPEMRE